MKILAYLLFVLLLQQASAQNVPANKFILTGYLTGAPVDSAMFTYSYTAGKYVSETVAVTNGKFVLSGFVNHPAITHLLFFNKHVKVTEDYRNEHSTIMYLEPGALKITGNLKNLMSIKLTGSKAEVEWEGFTKLPAVNDGISAVEYNFFLKHPQSYVTLDCLGDYIGMMRIDSVKRIYNSFTSKQKESTKGNKIASQISEIVANLPGHLAQNFESTEINGKPLALTNFKGKYVILDFWASWCVPCRKANPHMIYLYNKYKGKGLDIIGIAQDDMKSSNWRTAVAKDKVGIYHQILSGLDMDLAMKGIENQKDIVKKYGIQSFPTKMLINPSGEIIGRFGDSNGGTDKDMDRMLAEIFDKK